MTNISDCPIYYNKDFESLVDGVPFNLCRGIRRFEDPYSMRLIILDEDPISKRIIHEKYCIINDPIYYEYSSIKRIGKTKFQITMSQYQIAFSTSKENLVEGAYFTLSEFKGENWFQISKIESQNASLLITCQMLRIGKKLKRMKHRYIENRYMILLNQFNRGYSNSEIFNLSNEFLPVSKKFNLLTNDYIDHRLKEY